MISYLILFLFEHVRVEYGSMQICIYNLVYDTAVTSDTLWHVLENSFNESADAKVLLLWESFKQKTFPTTFKNVNLCAWKKQICMLMLMSWNRVKTKYLTHLHTLTFGIVFIQYILTIKINNQLF